MAVLEPHRCNRRLLACRGWYQHLLHSRNSTTVWLVCEMRGRAGSRVERCVRGCLVDVLELHERPFVNLKARPLCHCGTKQLCKQLCRRLLEGWVGSCSR